MDNQTNTNDISTRFDAPRPTASVVIPYYNESETLEDLLKKIRQKHPQIEIIVVDDGSEKSPSTICDTYAAILISHPYNKGNGAAIKTGCRSATGDCVIFMDADGQHDPCHIDRFIDKIAFGYDMVVGARSSDSQATTSRRIANAFYNRIASWITGHEILDLTSGYRAMRKECLMPLLYLLPNRFSYPTTTTMAFFRSGYSVNYLDIRVERRKDKTSHIKPVRDGLRFLIIIFRVGTLYSPLKVFVPISIMHFTIGLFYYGYTYFTQGRFTNMGAALLIVSVLIFLIGLVSEQITNLLYSTTPATIRQHKTSPDSSTDYRPTTTS